MNIEGLQFKKVFSSHFDINTLSILIDLKSVVTNNSFKQELHQTKKDIRTGNIPFSGTVLGRLAAIRDFPFELLEKILTISGDLYICDGLTKKTKWKDSRMVKLLKEYEAAQKSNSQ